jgi:hypothetical protein
MVIGSVEARRMSDWSAPIMLEGGDAQSADSVQVAMNAAGDAVVAWRSYDGDSWAINATTYVDGSWSGVSTLSADMSDCGAPAVGIDDAGNAVVVYWQYSGSNFFVKAVSLTDGSWGEVTTIGSYLFDVPEPKVAMSSNGDAVAIWRGETSGVYHIMTCRYQEGNWDQAEAISDMTYIGSSPQVAVNGTGDAVAVWCESREGISVICGALLVGGVWGDPELISVGSGDCSNPDVAMNDMGLSAVAWQQRDGGMYAINGTIGLGGNWLEQGTFSASGVPSTDPQVAVDDSFNMGVVWAADRGASGFVIEGMTLYQGVWSPVVALSSTGNTSSSPQIAVDAYGEMVVVWKEDSATVSIINARGYANGAWGSVQMVADGYEMLSPQVAMNDDGGAIAVWYEQDQLTGDKSVFASIYTPNNAPAVTITSPAEDDIIENSAVKVEWTGTNVDHYTVSIDGAAAVDVSKATNVTVEDLADGEHNVNVTAYSIRGTSAWREVNFIVDTSAPVLAITNPAIGAWYNTSTMNVTWTASDAGSGIHNMSVSMDGGAWTDVATSYFEFTDLADGQHNVSVRVYDNAGHYRTAYKLFNIDTVLPILDITDPEEDAIINSTGVELVWEGSSLSTIGRYWLSVDGSEFVDVGQNTSRILSGLAEGAHTVTLKARDYAGNYNSTSVDFTVDSVAPAVSITAPADGQRTKEASVTVEWTVTETGSGVDSVEVSIDGGDWTTVTGDSYDLQDLADGTHTFAVRATDIAGNVAEATVSFVVDTIAPTASVQPSGEGLSTSTVITVTFSEAMNQSSVAITVEGFDSVTGTVSWDGNVATFTPSSALPYNMGYTVNVTGKDLAGNDMIEVSSGFTTMKDESTITGMVKDKNGQPLGNATVTLSNGMTTTTDVTGYFEFTGVPSGSYTMNITKDGFTMVSQTVNAVAGQTTALESISLASSPSSSDGGNVWMLGIVGVVIVALLAVAFIVYRYKKK